MFSKVRVWGENGCVEALQRLRTEATTAWPKGVGGETGSRALEKAVQPWVVAGCCLITHRLAGKGPGESHPCLPPARLTQR